MRIKAYFEVALLLLGEATSLKGAPIFFEKAHQRSERGSLHQNVEQETLYRRRQAEMDEGRRDSSFPHESSETSSESRTQLNEQSLREELARLYEQVERAAQEWKEQDSSSTSIEEQMRLRSKVEDAVEDLLDEKDFYDAQTGEEFETRAHVSSLGERQLVAEKSAREGSEVNGCQEFEKLKSQTQTCLASSPFKKITKQSSSLNCVAKTLLGYLAVSSLLHKAHADLATSLVAHYPFDGNANDTSGNGNHGVTHFVSMSFDRFGTPNSSYSFNGANSYIQVSNGSPFDFANSFSVAFWVKPSATQGSWATSFSKSNSASGGSSWLISQNSGATNNFRPRYVSQSGTETYFPYINLPADQWQHYAMTKEGTQLRAYLNGNLVGTDTASNARIKTNGNLPLFIGGASSSVQLFKGLLDDIFIFNRTLSSGEIASLISLQNPTAAPTLAPTKAPTPAPTQAPTASPTFTTATALGPEFQMSTLTTGNSYYPSVAALTGGGFVATWHNTAPPFKIYGRRYDSRGVALGSSEFQISTLATGNNQFASAAPLSGGGFVVTWQNEASPYQIYGRRYDSSGVPIESSEFQISTLTTGNNAYPTIAALSGGGFVVTWYNQNAPARIYGRCYDSSGAALESSEFQISTLTTGNNQFPSVAALSGGGFVVVWNSCGSPCAIYGRRYDSNGVAIEGSEFQISTLTNGNNLVPNVAALSGGGFVVTWHNTAAPSKIYGRRYDSSGVALESSEFQINTLTTGSYNNPSVAPLNGGGFIVTWYNTASPAKIYGRRYDSSGAPMESSEFEISTLATGSNQFPSVAASSAGDYLVTWHLTGSPGNIYGRLFAANPFPTSQPSRQPSAQPTAQPSRQPSSQPSVQPTRQPTSQPSRQPSGQPTSAPTSLSTGLVAHYPFDGDANDASGNGNHGTANSVTAAADRFGAPGKAFSFNGASSYVEVIDGSPFNINNEFALSLWVKPGNVQQQTYANILDKSHGSAPLGWAIEQNNIINNNYYFQPSPSCLFQLTPNVWNHLGMTKNSTGTYHYLNNRLTGSCSFAPTSTDSLPFVIGAWNSARTQPASGLGRFFNGLLDEIRIYNRALAPHEIAQLYSFQNPTVQPTQAPTLSPTEIPTASPTALPRKNAFAIFSGLGSDFIEPQSFQIIPDGSYIVGGHVYKNSIGASSTGLLGKLTTEGEQEWFEQLASSYPNIEILSTALSGNFLYGGGRIWNNRWNPYLSKSSLNGTLLSSWLFSGVPNAAYITNIFSTLNNSLLCFGYVSGRSSFVFEYNPHQEEILSSHFIDNPANNILGAAVAASDGSYIIGGNAETGAPNHFSRGWLSKIKYNGTAWEELWTRRYLNLNYAYIRSIKENKNRILFAGSVLSSGNNNDGWVGSINGSTGNTDWVVTLGGTRHDYFSDVAINDFGKIMAVGNTFSRTLSSNKAAWYTLLNANNGTLRKSIIIDGSAEDYAQSVVTNDDGTFTSIGSTGHGDSSANLLFATFGRDAEFETTLIPPAIDYLHNNGNITSGGQATTTIIDSISFSPLALSSVNIRSLLFKVNDPISPFGKPSSQPTSQPSRQPSAQPTRQPSRQPSSQPSVQPTRQPTSQPSRQPTSQPTLQPTSFISGSLKDGLIAHYPFDGNARDQSGNGNNGVVHSATLTTDRFGKSNSAYSFDGSTSYIEVVNGSPFDFSTQFGISLWIKQLTSESTCRHIMSKASNPSGWLIEKCDNSNYINFWMYPGSPSSDVTSSHIQSPSFWNHWACTKKAESVRCYLNGVLHLARNASFASIASNGNLPLIIGANNAGRTTPASSLVQFFNGFLDDIFIYNRTLTPKEVLSLYQFDAPTSQPSSQPSVQPTRQPSRQPSGQPTSQPSAQPTRQPTSQPSAQPSGQPFSKPTSQPSGQPSGKPSAQPSSDPSSQPTGQPSRQPSDQPTRQPSSRPTLQPFGWPTGQPTVVPTGQPSEQPTSQPSFLPTGQPSLQPSAQPSSQPSVMPTTQPTLEPTSQPTTAPTAQPSSAPTTQPSQQPSSQPSLSPSTQPTLIPSTQPSAQPSGQPSGQPSSQPSLIPTAQPTHQPSVIPTSQPSVIPSTQPSATPSSQLGVAPTSQPSRVPSSQPSAQPSGQPTAQPSSQPTLQPTAQPSTQPTVQPSQQPSAQPSGQPSAQPSRQPSTQPSRQPSRQPTSQPTKQPASLPTGQPSKRPTALPTSVPSSSSPTGAPPTGEWMSLLGKGSSVRRLTQLNNKLIACGNAVENQFASCFSFDATTGNFLGKHQLPWSRITSVFTSGENQLLLEGTDSSSRRSLLAFCDVNKEPWRCRLADVSWVTPGGSIWNPILKTIFSLGKLSGSPLISRFDAQGNRLAAWMHENSKWVSLEWKAATATSRFFGTCLGGVILGSDLNTKVITAWGDNNDLINFPIVMIPTGKKIRNSDNLVNAVFMDSLTQRMSLSGGIDVNDGKGIQPYMMQVHPFYQQWLFGKRYLTTSGTSNIKGMSLLDDALYLIGDTTTSENSQHHLSVLKVDRAFGTLLDQVRVSGPGDIVCSDLQIANNRLNIACDLVTPQSRQALLFSANSHLDFQKLPLGYEKKNVADFVAEDLSFSTLPEEIESRASILPTLTQSYFNSSLGSFTQQVTTRAPSLDPTPRPTAIPTTYTPTAAPSTPQPTSQPSAQPSSQPSLQPSSAPTARPTISARPTSVPSSSVPTLTHNPTTNPSSQPSGQPSRQPVARPTSQPTSEPTRQPSIRPSLQPSSQPTSSPSLRSHAPSSHLPSLRPTATPSAYPTVLPTLQMIASLRPSVAPSASAEDKKEIPPYVIGSAVVGSCIGVGLSAWLVYQCAYQKKKELATKVVPHRDGLPEGDQQQQIPAPISDLEAQEIRKEEKTVSTSPSTPSVVQQVTALKVAPQEPLPATPTPPVVKKEKSIDSADEIESHASWNLSEESSAASDSGSSENESQDDTTFNK